MIKKLLLLVILFISFVFFVSSSFSLKPAQAAGTCTSSTCNRSTGCMCNGPTCQTQRQGCSNSTVVCGGAANVPCCVYEWALGSTCPQTSCNGGAGCGPVTKYSCINNACAADPSGTYTDSSCGGACAPPPGGGGNPAPPPRTFQNEPLCHAVGQPCSNTSGSSGSTNLNSIGCCYPLICWTGYTGGGSMLETTCQRPQTPSTNQSCNGVFCETAVGDIATNNPGRLVQSIFAVLLSISGGIAVILIIISGYRLMTSRGNPEQVQMAKEQLTAAIVGLLFIIFSLVVLQTIGVNILNLPTFKSN